MALMFPGEPQIAGDRAAAAPGRHAVDRRPLTPAVVVALVRVADVIAIIAAAWLAYLLYPGVMWTGSQHVAAVGAAVFVASAAFSLCGAYRAEHLLTGESNVLRACSGWLIALAFLLVIAFALKISAVYSRFWVFAWFGLALLFIALERRFVARRVQAWAREFRLADRTVILGASAHGQRIAARIQDEGDVRTRVVGFVDDGAGHLPRVVQGHPVLGDVDHLITLIRRNRVDQVIIALPWTEDRRIIELAGRLAMLPVNVRLAPDRVGFELAARSFTRVAGLPMLHLFDRPMSGWPRVIKELEDRVGGGLLFLLAAPLMALIALAVRLDSPGPAFFRQRRYGFNNELIEVYKFRTMHAHLADADGAVQARRSDPRVTRVGRLLRTLSLDELPQLINVVRGEMSLVGPRPHAVLTKTAGRLFEEAVDNYASRHRVKPGMTGWAQVNGWRGETDTIEKLAKRIEHDLYYIENWSPWLDLRILARTFYILLTEKNAY